MTHDLTEALQETSLLSTLYMRTWNPMPVDRTLSTDVADARQSTASAFQVRKKLLAGADGNFKAVARIQTEFRNYHYRHTLPFSPTTAGGNDRGPRLLSNAKFFEYAGEVARARTDMAEAIGVAKTGYAASVQIAKATLGSAFDPGDYPDVEEFDRLFSIEVDFTPVPDSRGFRGLPQETLDKLGSYIERKLGEKAAKATADLAERVAEYLQRLDGRLSALDDSVGVEGVRKATIRKSLFDEAGHLADMIGAFEFAADERCKAAATLLREVSTNDATSIEHDAVRSDLIGRAQDLISAFR